MPHDGLSLAGVEGWPMNTLIVLGLIVLFYISLEVRGEMAIRDSERERQEREDGDVDSRSIQ
jgi:hypothetical protein